MFCNIIVDPWVQSVHLRASKVGDVLAFDDAADLLQVVLFDIADREPQLNFFPSSHEALNGSVLDFEDAADKLFVAFMAVYEEFADFFELKSQAFWMLFGAWRTVSLFAHVGGLHAIEVVAEFADEMGLRTGDLYLAETKRALEFFVWLHDSISNLLYSYGYRHI